MITGWAPFFEVLGSEGAADANGWKPISTAPKAEGVSVLMGWAIEGNWPPCVGFWSGDYHGQHAWCDDATENDFVPQPTHWQPLPPKPLVTPC